MRHLGAQPPTPLKVKDMMPTPVRFNQLILSKGEESDKPDRCNNVEHYHLVMGLWCIDPADLGNFIFYRRRRF
ncbi:MAG: hypothetical protein Q7J65_01450, partial [Candidatus Marinimicrobia bacterium]|nr:hypothetical protein [Candidatus Neomarinimicrobiota bacterium]